MMTPAAVKSRAASMLARLARWRRFLRLRPFDPSTVDGRSAERYRRIAWSTLLSIVARAAAIGLSFIAIPLVVGYLGSERYGMWLTMTALVGVLGPLDLGIGNGLLQFVSDASARDEREAARRAVSTALVLLAAIALFAGALVAVGYGFIPWAGLYNVGSGQAISEAGPASATLIAIFIIGLPLSVVGVIQAAYQSSFVTSLWSGLATAVSLAALLLAINAKAPLPALILALTGAGLVAALLNAIVLFGWQRPWLRPSLALFRSRDAGILLRTGILFVVLQLAGLAAYQLDNVVIAQVLGSEAVQQYAIPVKLFSLAPTLVSFALLPLWPAYREALARGDQEWVRRTLRRSVKLSLAINVPAAIFLVVAGASILQLWVGTAVTPTPVLLVGLGIWIVMNSLSGPLAMLLNGANAMLFQAVCAVLMAITNVSLSIFLVGRIGVSGAVFGSILAQVIFVLAPSAWYVPRLLARVRTSSEPAAS